MRYPAWPLLALLFIAASPSPAADLRYLQSIGDAEYHHVESELVGRAYHVYVALPAGYQEETGRTYPTIYVLDGGELFPLFTSYYRYLNFGEDWRTDFTYPRVVGWPIRARYLRERQLSQYRLHRAVR